MANRPADQPTTRHPSKYMCNAVGGRRVDELTRLVACPRCGKAILGSASYCDCCRKEAAS